MFRIRYRTGAFEIEVESDEKDFVTSKFAELLASATDEAPGTKVLGTSAQPSPVAPPGTAKELSVQEFLRELKPASGTEFVVGIGFFLEKHKGLSSFAASDIKEGFLKAKFNHSNPSDAIAKARAQGRLMEGSERGTYVLTRSGEEWVELQLKNAQ